MGPSASVRNASCRARRPCRAISLRLSTLIFSRRTLRRRSHLNIDDLPVTTTMTTRTPVLPHETSYVSQCLSDERYSHIICSFQPGKAPVPRLNRLRSFNYCVSWLLVTLKNFTRAALLLFVLEIIVVRTVLWEGRSREARAIAIDPPSQNWILKPTPASLRAVAPYHCCRHQDGN